MPGSAERPSGLGSELLPWAKGTQPACPPPFSREMPLTGAYCARGQKKFKLLAPAPKPMPVAYTHFTWMLSQP